MKFFLDTANLEEIEEAASWGVLAGVTTNPSLYAKIGGKLADFESHMKRICDIVGPDCPVSAESVAMTDACLAGDYPTAAKLQCKMLPLIQALFCEVNPIPAKAAAAAMGFGHENIRMPLSRMEDANRQRLLTEMRKLGLSV